jgi:hypothetical protein
VGATYDGFCTLRVASGELLEHLESGKAVPFPIAPKGERLAIAGLEIAGFEALSAAKSVRT